jgi:hypothetical protein
LPADQFAAVENAQPYKRNSVLVHTDWLWVLSELDNIDKHRTILVVDPRLMIKTTIGGRTTVVKQPFVSGSSGSKGELPSSASASEVDMQETAIVLVLADTGLACDNIQAIRVWRNMIDAVKGIIGTFERFF